MGNTLHIQIKHEIEYGECGFNWQITELQHLLKDNGCSILDNLNDDGIGDWEIDECEFKNAVQKISEMDASAIRAYFPDYLENITDEKFKEQVVSLLKKFVTTGDCRNGYYIFSWF